jgi:hypothetical protein
MVVGRGGTEERRNRRKEEQEEEREVMPCLPHVIPAGI